jgi:hypothetical protein
VGLLQSKWNTLPFRRYPQRLKPHNRRLWAARLKPRPFKERIHETLSTSHYELPTTYYELNYSHSMVPGGLEVMS